MDLDNAINKVDLANARIFMSKLTLSDAMPGPPTKNEIIIPTSKTT